MEVSFTLLLYIILVLACIVIAYSFYQYVKGKGGNLLDEILDIPNYIKKMFGG